MVLFGGHAWFYSGGVHGFIQGGVRGFIGGACVVLSGGHVWFYSGGGMRGFSSFFGYNEIQSMRGRYASYWNAFLSWKYDHPYVAHMKMSHHFRAAI